MPEEKDLLDETFLPAVMRRLTSGDDQVGTRVGRLMIKQGLACFPPDERRDVATQIILELYNAEETDPVGEDDAG